MIFNFPEIRGSNDEREEIITQLREKIMGYWAAKDLVNMKKIKTPDYRAYQLYLEFLKSTDDQSKLAEILEIDSLFFLPRIQFLNINRPGLQGDNTIHFDFLERHRDQLSDYETKWLDYLKNMYLGNPLKTFESINALRLKYPKDFAVNHETAVVAHEGLNNPELASEIYDELQITEDHRQHVGVLFNWRLTHRVITANKSHDPETIQTRMNSVVPDDNVQFYVLFSKLIGSSLVNDQKTFDAILSHMIDADKEIDGYKIYALSDLFNTNVLKRSQRDQVLSAIRAIVDNSDQKEQFRALFKNFFDFVETGNSSIDFDSLSLLPDALQMFNLRWATIAMIECGRKDQIEEIIKKLESFTAPNLKYSAWFVAGRANYTLGLIHMFRKDEKKALEYFKRSRELGMPSQLMITFKYDRYLEPLYDNPEFQELNEPRWPVVVD